MFKKLREARERYKEQQAEKAPFYVSSEGALFAKAEEVVRSQVVQRQLRDFAVLHEKILSDRKSASEAGSSSQPC